MSRLMLIQPNGDVLAEITDPTSKALIEGKCGVIEWRGLHYVYSPFHRNGEFEFFVQAGSLAHITDSALAIHKRVDAAAGVKPTLHYEEPESAQSTEPEHA